MSMQYKNPNGTPSSIEGAGSQQMHTYLYHRAAVIAAQDEVYFGPLADSMNMPKNYGKEIRVYEYIPLLDDRNVNDQGINAAGVTIANGNLYGSSKDVGTINGAIPVLGENGGRVNRVGFKRVTLSGSIMECGFFWEFTEDMNQFDSDADLYKHLSREAVVGATKINEALLQRDLLANAGTIHYAGAAVSHATVTGEGLIPSEVTYDDLIRVSRVLTDNHTPLKTKIIKGSQLVDTVTLNGARILYIGSPLEKTFMSMTDFHGDPAFVPVNKYASQVNILNGEIGQVAQFRIVVNPQMFYWDGEGAVATGANLGYLDNGTNYNVYPALIVGDDAFVTIGFQSSGKDTAMKFKIRTKMPGDAVADKTDPFGKTGFSAISWWYGFLAKRPERIALIKTVAKA